MSDIKQHDKALSFIFDWRSRTEKKQRKFVAITVGAFFIATIACVCLFLFFHNTNYERIVNLNMNFLQDRATQRSIQIENDITTAQERLSQIAKQCSEMLDTGIDINSKDIVHSFENQTVFTTLKFVGKDGIFEDVDLTDENVFKKGMAGKYGYDSLDIDKTDNKRSIAFYAPVTKNGEVQGVLIGVFGEEKFDYLLNFHMFNYIPNTYVLTEDGDVILRSEDAMPDKNIFDRLKEKQFRGDVGFDEVQEIVASDVHRTINFTFIENDETSVGSISQFKSSKWIVMSVLGNGVVDDMASNANRVGAIFLTGIICVFVALMIVLLFSFDRQKNSLEEEIKGAIYNLEKILDEERKQLSIIKTLADIYSSVYYTSVEDMKYLRLKENAEISAVFDNVGPTKETYDNYVDRYVEERYRQEMHTFLNADTVVERLRDTEVLSHEYKRIDKGWQRAMITAVSRDDDGEVTSFILAVQSINDEKIRELDSKEALEAAYDAAQIASRAKSNFLSNMSHDIRTPMNAIIGMTSIAAANIDNQEKVSDCLSKITTSSKHLLGLINEVLDMSKIESGNVDLNEEEFSLSDTISNLITLHQPLAQAKNHHLSIKIKDVVHENVIGDSIRLQQVFTNLLSNAIKYTPENGEIEVTVTEKNTNKQKIGWYEVSFKDNGIGMSEQFVKNIFEPFTRAEDDRITNIQGTGLGMPIARNIIRMMNGDIKVESKLNEGSKFTVSFALKLQGEEDVDYSNFVDLNILVVDDDEQSCECTCLICDSLGMKSEYVLSGQEAIEKTVEHHNNDDDYYAIILDWRMPNMDGVTTAREIRKRVGWQMPIIVLTAYDWTEIEREAREAGVDAFLSKPLFKSRVAHLFNDLTCHADNTEFDDINVQTEKDDFSGRRILLVEDNELNREITTELLSMLNIETECAVNGKVGVDMFSQSEPGYYDLIFMDIQMPVMNGYDATSAIRTLAHHDAKIIPIIAMTANAFASDVRAAYNAGMNAHISKPIDMEHIIKTLHEYFD